GRASPPPLRFGGRAAGPTPPPPQATCPAGQQIPLEQLPLAQTLPQLPQWAGLVCWLTHAPLQTSCPDGQTHAPLTQLAPVAQALSQAPQLAVVFRGVHTPLQQPAPSAQALPQAPQLLVLVWGLTHALLQHGE